MKQVQTDTEPLRLIRLTMGQEYTEEKSFDKIDFTRIPLMKGEYESCNFISCDFSNSDLASIVFMECGFENCNLSTVKDLLEKIK